LLTVNWFSLSIGSVNCLSTKSMYKSMQRMNTVSAHPLLLPDPTSGSPCRIIDSTLIVTACTFPSAGVFVFTPRYNSNTFGIGTGAILYVDLNCDGTEISLRECSSSYNNPQYCSHYRYLDRRYSGDVGVQCDHIGNSGIIMCQS